MFKAFQIFAFMVLYVAFSGDVFADEKTTFEDSIPTELIARGDRFFTFTFENDSIGSGTDENYTNGVRATYMKVGEEPGAIGRILEEYIPTFEINDTTTTFYSAGQNLYTPEDISARIADPDNVSTS